MKVLGLRLVLAGLTVAAAASLAAPALAGPGQRGHRENRPRPEHGWRSHGPDARGWQGHGARKHGAREWRYAHRRAPASYVVTRRRGAVVLHPACADCFVVYRPRFVVVRPVPCWPVRCGGGVLARVGIHLGSVRLGLGFDRCDPYYGCGFCDAYYPSYHDWEAHAGVCAARPAARVLCEPWDEGDLETFRADARRAWEEQRGGW